MYIYIFQVFSPEEMKKYKLFTVMIYNLSETIIEVLIFRWRFDNANIWWIMPVDVYWKWNSPGFDTIVYQE